MANRNSEAHFELAPQVAIERSTMDRSTDIKTSFNIGELIPFFVDEVLPGDTFEIQTSKVARLQTLIAPVMDNMYLDTYYFFVPNRLVWDHWQEFCGENTRSAWYPSVSYTVPKVQAPVEGWNIGTVADYMGIPTNIREVVETEQFDWGFNALPFRAYALICNEWFRDENLQKPLVISHGDATEVGLNDDSLAAPALGGKPFIAAKYHDYFTSCLPAPQKGPEVSFLDGFAPIVTRSESIPDMSNYAVRFTDRFDNYPPDGERAPIYWFSDSNSSINNRGMAYVNAEDFESDPGSEEPVYLQPENLWADLRNAVVEKKYPGLSVSNFSPLSINALRQAFQIQRLLERDARSGTRYIEVLKAHFNVTSPDARLQRPEYLGGNRVPVNIEQVLQTSSTDGTSPQGNIAGWSQTNDSNFDVNKSFTEHGYIIGLICARYEHSYQQGVEPMWTRRTRFDFYWPALAHLGEKAVNTREIYYDGTFENWIDVFGYQEAWAEYRYKPNYVTGQMRSAANGSLDIWHFGDYYESQPYLSDAWIQEDKSNVDRTLAVQSSNAHQIFCDIYVKNKCTRPMPLYSIPGLIDHF